MKSEAARFLERRTALAKSDRSMAKAGAIIRGTKAVRGTYVCTTCGFCAFHHDGPRCESSAWIKNDAGCCLCGVRGMLMDLGKPRMSWWVAREAGMRAFVYSSENGMGAMRGVHRQCTTWHHYVEFMINNGLQDSLEGESGPTLRSRI